MKQVFSFVALLLVQHVLSLPTALSGHAPHQEQAHGAVVRSISSRRGVAVKRSPDDQFDSSQRPDPLTTLDEQDATSATLGDAVTDAIKSGNQTAVGQAIDQLQAATNTSGARIGGPHNVGWMHTAQSNLFSGGWSKAKARARRSIRFINKRYNKDRNITEMEFDFKQLTAEKPENETFVQDHLARAHAAAKSLWITSGLSDIVARNEPMTISAAAQKLNVTSDELKGMIAAGQLPQHLEIHRGDRIGLAHRPQASLFQVSNQGSIVARNENVNEESLTGDPVVELGDPQIKDEPECPPGAPCSKHAETHHSSLSLFIPFAGNFKKREEDTTPAHDPMDINSDGKPDSFTAISAQRHVRHQSLFDVIGSIFKRQDPGSDDDCRKVGWMHTAASSLFGRLVRRQDSDCSQGGPSEMPVSTVQVSQTPAT